MAMWPLQHVLVHVCGFMTYLITQSHSIHLQSVVLRPSPQHPPQLQVDNASNLTTELSQVPAVHGLCVQEASECSVTAAYQKDETLQPMTLVLTEPSNQPALHPLGHWPSLRCGDDLFGSMYL